MLCSQRLRRFASIRTCFFDERHGPLLELRSHFYPYKNDKTRPAGGSNQTKYDETRPPGGLNQTTYDKTRPPGGLNQTTYDKTRPPGGLNQTTYDKTRPPGGLNQTTYDIRQTRLAGGFRAIPALGMEVIAKQANYLPAF